MSVIAGGSYRVRARRPEGMVDDPFALGLHDRLCDTEADVRQAVADLRYAGAEAVAVDYVSFVVAEESYSHLGFGDYWGDGEDED
ncbi:hypothetical protein [Streptomyces sp. CB03911]|uniref:hypothetical protein n=1 Tax=Streptomyces sp. CB03911 TaxID=1804758 RepID=UPI00093BFFCE|nr:hypothetical protein [Streptomyces sp. CB03911]OKI19279.1 hypothetical protein A6A07_07195 [Streptomyces sp. CB03911]